jgi:leucyl-tRNA synthetase
LAHAWEWTHKYGGVILDQLKKLGSSCDWDRTKFTMDPDMSASVIRSFVDFAQRFSYNVSNLKPDTTYSSDDNQYFIMLSETIRGNNGPALTTPA